MIDFHIKNKYMVWCDETKSYRMTRKGQTVYGKLGDPAKWVSEEEQRRIDEEKSNRLRELAYRRKKVSDMRKD